MLSKKELLKNLSNYSPDQIAEAIRNGVVSQYDLTTGSEGAYTPLLKRRVNSILANPATPVGTPQNQEAVSGVEVAPIVIPDVGPTVATTPAPASIPAPSPSSSPAPVAAPTAAPAPAQAPTPNANPVAAPVANPIAAPEMQPTAVAAVPPAAPLNVEPQALQNSGSAEGYTIGSQVEERPTIRNKGMFTKPFSFHGRIRRLEYGLSCIIGFSVNILANILAIAVNSVPESFILYFLFVIPACWFLLAQGAKRCHDAGYSGWFIIIPFFYIIVIFIPGRKGSNIYGNNPKEFF